MDKLIIEVRVNEFAGREINPNVPFTPEEIATDAVLCEKEGAAILHFHSRLPDGTPSTDKRVYDETIQRIRARTGMLVHTTLGFMAIDSNPAGRVAHLSGVEGDPSVRTDFAGVDLNSLNIDRWDREGKRFETKDSIYRNTTGDIEFIISHLQSIGIKPYLACWTVGAVRMASALLENGLLKGPIYTGMVLTQPPLIAGHPGTWEGLEALKKFLPSAYRNNWTAMMVNGDILTLAERIIGDGGNISIGLGDYAYPGGSFSRNSDIVARVVDVAERMGRKVATPREAAAIVGLPS